MVEPGHSPRVVEERCFLPRPVGEVLAIVGEEQFGEQSFRDISFPIPEGAGPQRGVVRPPDGAGRSVRGGCNPGGGGPSLPALSRAHRCRVTRLR